MKPDEIPLGFGMALAQNQRAMQKFALFSEEKQRQVIEGTHSIASREGMQLYVARLAEEEEDRS